MNNFQNTSTGKGLLTDAYEDNVSDPTSILLKKKRDKLLETKRLGTSPDNEEEQAAKDQDGKP